MKRFVSKNIVLSLTIFSAALAFADSEQLEKEAAEKAVNAATSAAQAATSAADEAHDNPNAQPAEKDAKDKKAAALHDHAYKKQLAIQVDRKAHRQHPKPEVQEVFDEPKIDTTPEQHKNEKLRHLERANGNEGLN